MDFKQEITRLKRVVYFLNRTSTTIIGSLVTLLSQLSDVSIYEPSDGDILVYNSDTGLWENVPQENIDGSNIYNLTNPTTITVGNLVSGSTITGLTSNEILELILTGGHGNILMEDNFDILMEDSSLILIE